MPVALIKKNLKRAASYLPARVQSEMRRLIHARAITKGRFVSKEPEFDLLDQWVSPGDCVVDVGANVGHYTIRLSKLVGETGRVFAFEPVPETFSILAANVARMSQPNVTLINCAASNIFQTVGIAIPKYDTGLSNFYMAHITNEDADSSVYAMPLDAIDLPSAPTLVKIDAEGHDFCVIKGMMNIFQYSLPTLIVEDRSDKTAEFLGSIGYEFSENEGSSNRVFSARAARN